MTCAAFEGLKAGDDPFTLALIDGVEEHTWYCEHGLIVAALDDFSLPDRTFFHNVDPAQIDHKYETKQLPQPLGA